MARLIDLLLSLNSRERGLLALLAITAILGLIFGGLLPLYEQRQSAKMAQREARALETWVVNRIAEKSTLIRGIPDPPKNPIGLSRIEQGLISARLRPQLSALTRKEGDELTLRFDQVDFLRFVSWLSATHPGWGYQFKSFRFEALEHSGEITAWITLRPAQP